jgi:hypothetical protein
MIVALDQPPLSPRFAKSSLEIAQKNDRPDVLATANEAIARAHAVATNYRAARNHLNKARSQLDSLTIDDEDRKIYLGQIRETEKMTHG